MKMKLVKSKKAKKAKRPAVSLSPGLIPQIITNPSYNQTFRYYATATANNLIISRGDLLNLLQVACSTGTAGTTGARLFYAVKVLWVTLYAPPQAAGGPTTVSLTWEGEYGQHKVVEAVTLGTAIPPVIHTKPPRDTESGFFSLTGSQESQPLFNVDVPQNTVVDINVTFTLQNLVDNSSVGVTTSSTKTVAQGVIYGAALDGTATNVFAPLGRNQW